MSDYANINQKIDDNNDNTDACGGWSAGSSARQGGMITDATKNSFTTYNCVNEWQMNVEQELLDEQNFRIRRIRIVELCP